MGRYAEVYESWKRDPEGFWMKAAEAIDWFEAPRTALDASDPPFHRWFPDAVGNTCWNAVDRHVSAGNGERRAIIYDSPITGAKATLSYAELQEKVQHAVAELPDHVREIRLLAYFQQFSYAKIAEILNIPLGTVKSRLHTAVAKFGERWKNANPESSGA